MFVAEQGSFAAKLKQLREAAGITQYRLAKIAGVSAQAVARIEKGEREPGWGTVVKLARALGVSVAEFDIGESPDDPADPGVNDDPEPPPPAPKRKKK